MDELTQFCVNLPPEWVQSIVAGGISGLVVTAATVAENFIGKPSTKTTRFGKIAATVVYVIANLRKPK